MKDENLSVEDVKALASCDTNPLWKVVLESLQLLEKREVEYALDPDITPDQRGYYAGRAAGVRDVTREFLRLRDECKAALS
jgi:hypothetical protein